MMTNFSAKLKFNFCGLENACFDVMVIYDELANKTV